MMEDAMEKPLSIKESKPSSHRVLLNIGGETFITYKSTLRKIPGTRLSNLTIAEEEYDPVSKEYFFDRNPRLFPYVLDVFRNGEIHFPHCYCAPAIQGELQYWGIPDDLISRCCYKSYREYEEEKQTLAQLEDALEGHEATEARRLAEAKGSTRWQRWRTKVWLFLEDPTYSLAAKIWSYIFVALLVTSVINLVLETHPSCRVVSEDWQPMIQPNTTNSKLLMYLNTAAHPVSRFLTQISNMIFFVELLLRFIVCPNRWRFFFSFFNIVDIFSVIPSFTITVIAFFNPYVLVENNLTIAYLVVSLSSVFRTVRILKLIKHNRGLRVMMLAIKASGREILLLFLLMGIGMLVFSTMIYYAEFGINKDEYSSFANIPIGFYWSIITMTTVGYGDMTPSSSFGYAIGSLCAITGMLITGLPIPVIANNFNLYYSYAKLRDDVKLKDMRTEAREVGEGKVTVQYEGQPDRRICWQEKQ